MCQMSGQATEPSSATCDGMTVPSRRHQSATWQVKFWGHAHQRAGQYTPSSEFNYVAMARSGTKYQKSGKVSVNGAQTGDAVAELGAEHVEGLLPAGSQFAGVILAASCGGTAQGQVGTGGRLTAAANRTSAGTGV